MSSTPTTTETQRPTQIESVLICKSFELRYSREDVNDVNSRFEYSSSVMRATRSTGHSSRNARWISPKAGSIVCLSSVSICICCVRDKIRRSELSEALLARMLVARFCDVLASLGVSGLSAEKGSINPTSTDFNPERNEQKNRLECYTRYCIEQRRYSWNQCSGTNRLKFRKEMRSSSKRYSLHR